MVVTPYTINVRGAAPVTAQVVRGYSIDGSFLGTLTHDPPNDPFR
jgi:hypothetical protein